MKFITGQFLNLQNVAGKGNAASSVPSEQASITTSNSLLTGQQTANKTSNFADLLQTLSGQNVPAKQKTQNIANITTDQTTSQIATQTNVSAETIYTTQNKASENGNNLVGQLQQGQGAKLKNLVNAEGLENVVATTSNAKSPATLTSANIDAKSSFNAPQHAAITPINQTVITEEIPELAQVITANTDSESLNSNSPNIINNNVGNPENIIAANTGLESLETNRPNIINNNVGNPENIIAANTSLESLETNSPNIINNNVVNPENIIAANTGLESLETNRPNIINNNVVNSENIIATNTGFESQAQATPLENTLEQGSVLNEKDVLSFANSIETENNIAGKSVAEIPSFQTVSQVKLPLADNNTTQNSELFISSNISSEKTISLQPQSNDGLPKSPVQISLQNEGGNNNSATINKPLNVIAQTLQNQDAASLPSKISIAVQNDNASNNQGLNNTNVKLQNTLQGQQNLILTTQDSEQTPFIERQAASIKNHTQNTMIQPQQEKILSQANQVKQDNFAAPFSHQKPHDGSNMTLAKTQGFAPQSQSQPAVATTATNIPAMNPVNSVANQTPSSPSSASFLPPATTTQNQTIVQQQQSQQMQQNPNQDSSLASEQNKNNPFVFSESMTLKNNSKVPLDQKNLAVVHERKTVSNSRNAASFNRNSSLEQNGLPLNSSRTSQASTGKTLSLNEQKTTASFTENFEALSQNGEAKLSQNLSVLTPSTQEPLNPLLGKAVAQKTNIEQPFFKTPIADQVAVNIQKAFQEGQDKITLKLNPTSLGKIDVQMEIEQTGHVRAIISASEPETLKMLKQESGALQEALNKAGLDTDNASLSFDLGDHGHGHSQEQYASGKHSFESDQSLEDYLGDSENLVWEDEDDYILKSEVPQGTFDSNNENELLDLVI